ncbi:MAG: hypothetical protein F6K22_31170 [Okeania sp. SIO2F4]|uniref:hypothetical protein n=1 Tax=Okeania sp. SIO2F4 TaxID=2607790 RepID=UPI00142BD9CA|nr:hypothetical protein [Okeania sp. SIO2F4]NES06883.1 hypothetical protein [Okeania sp. SIO2F4]
MSRVMDEQLKQLLQQINSATESSKIQQTMGSLLALTSRLPGIRQDFHPDYLEALNTTLLDVRRNLAQFLASADLDRVSASTLREHYVRWVNGFLKYDILDLYRCHRQELSLNVTQPERDEGEWLESLSEDGFNYQIFDSLDSLLQQEENQMTQNKGLILELYIESDPEGKLSGCHPQNYPNCNAKAIVEYFYLSDRSEKITVKEDWVIAKSKRELTIKKSTKRIILAAAEPKKPWQGFAKKQGINYQTLKAHWQRKCLPLLREIVRDIENNLDDYSQLLLKERPNNLARFPAREGRNFSQD